MQLREHMGGGEAKRAINDAQFHLDDWLPDAPVRRQKQTRQVEAWL